MNQLIIPKFDPPWDCFSNFAPAIIIIKNIMYPTVEHAYQAHKSLNPAEQEWVRNAPDAREAKKRGRQVTLREDFHLVKIPFMRLFVTLKFTTYEQYRKVLISTCDAILQEGNWWGDTFWGICKGEGSNHLGIILMEVRDVLKLLR